MKESPKRTIFAPMAKIRPFEAVRPQPQLAKQVASKPYDVLNSAEAKQEAVGNAFSFLHIKCGCSRRIYCLISYNFYGKIDFFECFI